MACRRMKRWVTLALVVFTLAFLFPTGKVSAADQVVTFPDANLQAAIRHKIQKPTGDIYQSHLQSITYLFAFDENISNLAGLEYCTNLSDLALSRNQITDISPLALLTNLTHLSLNSNRIIDISPLALLTNLTDLSLSLNQISDISSLALLTHLTDLDLFGNQITDISPLVSNGGMSSKTKIDLFSNPLSSESIGTFIPQLMGRGISVSFSQSSVQALTSSQTRTSEQSSTSTLPFSLFMIIVISVGGVLTIVMVFLWKNRPAHPVAYLWGASVSGAFVCLLLQVTSGLVVSSVAPDVYGTVVFLAGIGLLSYFVGGLAAGFMARRGIEPGSDVSVQGAISAVLASFTNMAVIFLYYPHAGISAYILVAIGFFIALGIGFMGGFAANRPKKAGTIDSGNRQ